MARSVSPKNTRKRKNRRSSSLKSTRRARSATRKKDLNLLPYLFYAALNSDLEKIRTLIGQGALNHTDRKLRPSHNIPRRYNNKPIKLCIAAIALTNYINNTNQNADESFELLRNAGIFNDKKYLQQIKRKNLIEPRVFVESSWDLPEIARLLVDIGFDVNKDTDHMGNTILMHAILRSMRDHNAYTQDEYSHFINAIFDLGVDINVQNQNGLDAFMIACAHSATDETWWNIFHDDGWNPFPNVWLVKLIIDNLERDRSRPKYNFNNKAAASDDANADRFTLEEELNELRRDIGDIANDDRNTILLDNAIKLISDYKQTTMKPSKSATRKTKADSSKR